MPRAAIHHPVLLSEVVEHLITDRDGIYLDATFGRGGHSKALLQQLGSKARLYALDQDPEAIAFAEEQFAQEQRFKIFAGNFAEVSQLLATENLANKLSGILLDLGVSSPQLDQAERGFSFRLDGPLDMRMNTQQGRTLAEALKQLKESELALILKEYGEERYARRIAHAICMERENTLLTSSVQLAEIIKKAHPAWERDQHPATRSFQALRIWLNGELKALTKALPQCVELLHSKGRLAVISFHSLEDRLVKRFLQQEEQGDLLLKKLPLKQADLKPRLRRLGSAIRPGTQEIKQNARSRSAILRIMEKV